MTTETNIDWQADFLRRLECIADQIDLCQSHSVAKPYASQLEAAEELLRGVWAQIQNGTHNG